MDKIKIKDLEVFANHGVYEEEKKLGQKFLISTTLFLETDGVDISDDLNRWVSYGDVCRHINSYMKKNTFNLLETVAEKLAKELLLKFDKIKEIKLEVKKPWAPIGLPLDYVSVEITRRWHMAYIGMGSNIGDRRKYLEDALIALNRDKNNEILKVSKWIETKPYGNSNQDDYINGCILLKTLYAPMELLKVLNEIEDMAGRVRKKKWEARTLDLDILFYDDLVYSSKTLTIPHYDLHNRAFVLESLVEIAPYHHNPVRGKTVGEMWEEKVKPCCQPSRQPVIKDLEDDDNPFNQ
jgi:dihydroneopterin aldolase/2-amino-4-hydroxy-6-hydroxymethyldihydropteridine diphosphokinase